MILKETIIFTKWVMKLDFTVKTVIISNLLKLQKGNFSNVKSVGDGIHELKINFQKGYRVYFTNINGEIVLLLCGGDKSSQQIDIAKAKEIKEYL
ncbi:MAG: type II toxin-antitoxin system RelE/ParE family toxin [Endomicrobium sp.]|jgi:putative addiction module killer protein|nr:type II toxin-antitoxin system RelE/ParE family toxin [Endomicrobium sp.]